MKAFVWACSWDCKTCKWEWAQLRGSGFGHVTLGLIQGQEVVPMGSWALISRELVLQDRLWTLPTSWKGLGHICSFKHISMAQWSDWDWVSKKLGPDQMNFWKAAVLGKGALERSTSPRAHRVIAVCSKKCVRVSIGHCRHSTGVRGAEHGSSCSAQPQRHRSP